MAVAFFDRETRVISRVVVDDKNPDTYVMRTYPPQKHESYIFVDGLYEGGWNREILSRIQARVDL